jgi:uncharacterized membrane protein YhhN
MGAQTLVLVAALGVAHIAARQGGWTRLAGVLKPLPIVLLVAAVLQAEVGHPAYRRLVAAALVASMAGDVLLLWRSRFVAGLLCFLVAHLLYIAAFAPDARLEAGAWLALAPFLGFAALVLRALWPHLGRHRGPVLLYVAVIGAMGWLAALRAFGAGAVTAGGVLALLGAAAFMASDTILAFDRFAHPFRGAQAAVMGTYYLAQTLLALSAAT